jgi:hypothetical protein
MARTKVLSQYFLGDFVEPNDEKIAEIASHTPIDFPSAEYEEIRQLFRSHYAITHRDLRLVFGEAWNALLYRYRAMDEYNKEFTALIKQRSDTPFEVFECRYKQEKALFGFYASAVSVIECFFFSNYIVGAILKPEEFSLGSKCLRQAYPNYITSKFKNNFTGETLTVKMIECNSDATHIVMRHERDVLSHRGAVHRDDTIGKIAISSNPKEIVNAKRKWDLFINEVTANHRRWLSATISSLMSTMHKFCLKYFGEAKPL